MVAVALANREVPASPEGVAMRRFFEVMPALALLGSAAFAGPHAGGTLVAHDTGLAYTSDRREYPSPPPSGQPGSVDNRIELGPTRVWKVYAAFPDPLSPRLRALAMGAAFPPTVVVLAGGVPTPSLDFEMLQGGWPGVSGSGVSIVFGLTKTESITECYWLGGYGYGHGGQWRLAPHPTGRAVFVDDSVPPHEDRIAGLSSIGFGQPGETRYPSVPVPGACCFRSCGCRVLLAYECEDQGGTVVGGPCEPNPCPPTQPGACCVGERCALLDECSCLASAGTYVGGDRACTPNPCLVAIEETTWGRIKAIYR
jgi:hypothetical protein